MITLLLAVGCSGRPALERGQAPDILLFTVDTLRPDRIGAYGRDAARTPHIDALAQRGVLFSAATTPLPRTTPALASMLTGWLPHRHGSREVGQPVTAGRSIAQSLADAGYTTVAVSGTPVAGPSQGLDAGFDHFSVHFDLPAPELVRQALEHTDTSRPLFLWIHAVDPHFPYLPAGAPDSPCQALGEQAASGDLQRVDLFTNRDGAAAAVLEDCLALYDAEVTVADAGLGAALDGLRLQGRTPGLVVFSSDHGEHFGEEGIYYEHGPSVHDAALRIPLIIAGTGVTPHKDSGVARLEDVAPTVLAAAGLPPLADTDGADLSSRLAGASPDRSLIALAESGNALHVRFFSTMRSGRPRRQLCLNDPPWSLCAKAKTPPRLYNHVEDPSLQQDLSTQHPDVASALLAAAARWPETARQRTARTQGVKLTAYPQLDGDYRYETLLLQQAGTARPTAPLQRAILSLPLQHAEPVDHEDALRALGYIE